MNRKTRFHSILGLMAASLCLLGPAADLRASSALNHRQLGNIPIIENGRIKPLDTFARNLLKRFAGRSRIEGYSAIRYLALLLMDPPATRDIRVFLISNPEILNAMGIPRRGKARNRYSFSELKPGLWRLQSLAIQSSRLPPAERGIVETEAIGLYNRIYTCGALMESLAIFRSNPEIHLTLPGGEKIFSDFDLLVNLEKLKELQKQYSRHPSGKNPLPARGISRLIRRIETPPENQPDTFFTIISPSLRGDTRQTAWITPSALFYHHQQPRPQVVRILSLLERIAEGYHRGDQEGYDRAIDRYLQLVFSSSVKIRPSALKTEIFYHRLAPFQRAKILYGLAVLAVMLSLVFRSGVLYRLGFFLVITGFGFHLGGVVLRFLITRKAPVTNLFETFVFTSLSVALLGILLEWKKTRNIGIITGGLSGFVLLMIAGRYATQGDTMTVLVAVLNSNFWLASHVITIVLGYAGIILSGFLGHVYLLQRVFRPSGKRREDRLNRIDQAIYALQAFGLVLTFLGTILGGIWADQSWGRFWGWDPKENGALVILLWSALLFHARKGGWIRKTGMAYGAVIGVIAVSLAWFGVNLLGVGLHSYGFTTGIAHTLFGFIGLELLFILVTAALLTGRRRPDSLPG